MRWCVYGYVTGIAAAYNGQLLHLGGIVVLAATKRQLQVSSIRLASFLHTESGSALCGEQMKFLFLLAG